MSSVSKSDLAARRLPFLGGILMLWAVAGGGLFVMMLGQILLGAIVLAVGIVLGLLLLSGRLRQGDRFATANLILLALGVLGFDVILVLQTPFVPPDRRAIWYAYLAIVTILSAATLYFASKIPRGTGETSPHA